MDKAVEVEYFATIFRSWNQCFSHEPIRFEYRPSEPFSLWLYITEVEDTGESITLICPISRELLEQAVSTGRAAGLGMVKIHPVQGKPGFLAIRVCEEKGVFASIRLPRGSLRNFLTQVRSASVVPAEKIFNDAFDKWRETLG